MKLMVAGDLHGDLNAAKNISNKALNESVDLVFLSGDLTLFGKGSEGMLKCFLDKNISTALIHGNHEDNSIIDFFSEVYGFTNFHGVGKVYDSVGFFGCGGANVGIDSLTEKEIYDTLVKGFYSISKNNLRKKVLISHVHPQGTIIESMSKFMKGSSGLRRAIEKLKPDYVFCSHVHEADGLEDMIGLTKIFCVGKGGRIFDI